MSEPEERPKLDLDLGTAFLPSWAQKSAKDNPYAKYEGRDSDRPGRRENRRPDRQDRSRQQRSGERRRPSGDRDPQRRSNRGGDSRGRHPSQGQGGEGSPRRGGNRPGHQDRGRQQRPRHRSRQEIIASLPGLKVTLVPDQKGVESLAKQIRMQGRAYPLFDIATLVLKRPDRFKVTTMLQPDAKGKPVSEQWKCLLDETLWISLSEAIEHVLNEHFDQFYERLKTETDPPKGNFSFVAQCGISGKILGPPNYHGYQDALRSLHAERFNRMNFDAYKDRVKIVREEEVVKKWIEDQSWKTEFKSKARPDASPMASWEDLIADFKEHHQAESLETGKTLSVSAAAALKTPSKPVQELIRFHVDDQRRFPLQVATILSQMFARQGLQFFKVNRTITHVSVARPKYLDMTETPVSEGVQKIVELIDSTPDCNRKKLLDTLCSTSAPAADSTKASEESPAPSAESATPAPQPAPAQATAEETAIITDLHWLIHQGHVIEFSNGKMETAKKPAARPAKNAKQEQNTTEKKNDPKPSSPEAKSAPEPTAPEPTAPEPTAPESTAPESTAPEPAAPESTAPESTAPEPTAPEPAAPEPTAPEPTAPEATAPETTAPETTAPETTAPETTVPEPTASEPTASEPTASEPTAPEPAAADIESSESSHSLPVAADENAEVSNQPSETEKSSE